MLQVMEATFQSAGACEAGASVDTLAGALMHMSLEVLFLLKLYLAEFLCLALECVNACSDAS